ncbi:MAG: histidine kinase [Bacteroidota bacterium]
MVESLIVYNTGEWGHRSLTHSVIYHGSLLVPRTIISYIFILYVLPHLFKKSQHGIQRTILVVLYFSISLYLYRAFLNKLSWPLFMGHVPFFDPFDIRLSSYSFLRMVTPLSLLLGIISVRKEYYLKLRNEQLQKEQLRSELNYLKAQINPHFLFNSFNNLYVLATEKSERTAPAIEKLSSLFRYILQSSSKEEISINDEVKMLHNYVELERLRYQDIKIDFQTNISDKERHLPPLLLLPFIENAFKHGASELLNGGIVRIEIKESSDQMILICQNTFEKESIESKTSGKGIRNVTKRLNLLFPNNFSLKQSSEESIYTVELMFPLTKNTNSEPSTHA